MAVNKVVYYGKTILDLTDDTVTAAKMLSGTTAHDKSGKKITGTYQSVTTCSVAMTNRAGEAVDIVYNTFANNVVSCVMESLASGATKTIANCVKNSIFTVSATNELEVPSSSNCSVKQSNTHSVIFEIGTGSGSAVSFTVSVPPKYTNLIPTATVVNGTAIYNGKGYKDGYRISSAISESAKSGYVMTGQMPYAKSADGQYKPIYIKGCTLDTTDSNCRWTGCPSGINATASNTIQLNGGATNASLMFSTYFTIETLGTNYYKLTPIQSAFTREIGSMLMSLKGSGANLIVTVDQPTE